MRFVGITRLLICDDWLILEANSLCWEAGMAAVWKEGGRSGNIGRGRGSQNWYLVCVQQFTVVLSLVENSNWKVQALCFGKVFHQSKETATPSCFYWFQFRSTGTEIIDTWYIFYIYSDIWTSFGIGGVGFNSKWFASAQFLVKIDTFASRF